MAYSPRIRFTEYFKSFWDLIMSSIDLNSDVGEGVGNEAQLLPLLSSCNIACGAHAGDETTMKAVIALALRHQVKIGAHPGYDDKAHFGRVALTLSRKQLKHSITTQILTLKNIATHLGASLHHVKPHGALYNKAAVDPETASVIIESILEIDETLILYAPYNSVLVERAQGVLPVWIEGFADRNYNTDYTLVSRSQENALITEPARVLEHIKTMVTHKELHCISGQKLPIQLDTLCVHGDTPQALEIVRYLRQQAALHQIKFV